MKPPRTKFNFVASKAAWNRFEFAAAGMPKTDDSFKHSLPKTSSDTFFKNFASYKTVLYPLSMLFQNFSLSTLVRCSVALPVCKSYTRSPSSCKKRDLIIG